MRSLLIVLCFAMATLSGCVWSTNPLSDPEESTVDEDLCGVWAHTTDGRIDGYTIVGRPDAGKLPPGAMVMHIFDVGERKKIATQPAPFVFFISKLGNHEYWNLIAHPEPIDHRSRPSLGKFDFDKWLQHAEHGFLFCRVERNKDALSVFHPDPEVTAKAVENGKLKGKVDRNSKKIPELSVHLSDSTANLQKFFATDAAKDLFQKMSDHTYKRLR